MDVVCLVIAVLVYTVRDADVESKFPWIKFGLPSNTATELVAVLAASFWVPVKAYQQALV